MQRALFLKILIIAGLMLLIGIPLMMIQSTIDERMSFRRQAVESIAADSVGVQELSGPVLVLPYTEEYDEEVPLDTPNGKKVTLVKRSQVHRQFVFPKELAVNGNIDTDRRYRGIHQVLVFSGQYALKGSFDVPARAAIARDYPKSRLTFGDPFVAVYVRDVRGIHNIPRIDIGGRTLEFEQGSGLTAFKSGLHAALALEAADGQHLPFSFALNLDGIENQSFVPLARDNQVSLHSNWPHPQFGGRFLPSPKGRRIDANGFSVSWNISSLASDAQQQFLKGENGPAERAVVADSFSVSFIEPVNVYSMADRATKYGMLFVGLTFAAVFLFEVLRRLPIHPVQYLLVGLALAIFFLLLVSLSEHMHFTRAYLIASAACIALIAYYVGHVMRDWRRGLAFGVGLTTLYGTLYGLLVSENSALVMGSLLLFALLAAIMVGTRKVNWYQIGQPDEAPAGS